MPPTDNNLNSIQVFESEFSHIPSSGKKLVFHGNKRQRKKKGIKFMKRELSAIWERSKVNIDDVTRPIQRG